MAVGFGNALLAILSGGAQGVSQGMARQRAEEEKALDRLLLQQQLGETARHNLATEARAAEPTMDIGPHLQRAGITDVGPGPISVPTAFAGPYLKALLERQQRQEELKAWTAGEPGAGPAPPSAAADANLINQAAGVPVIPYDYPAEPSLGLSTTAPAQPAPPKPRIVRSQTLGPGGLSMTRREEFPTITGQSALIADPSDPSGPGIRINFGFDPHTGLPVPGSRTLIGQAVAPESMQSAMAAVQGMGMPPSHPAFKATVQKYLLIQGPAFSQEAKGAALEQLQEVVRRQLAQGVPAPSGPGGPAAEGLDVSGAVRAGQAARVQEAGQTTAEREKASLAGSALLGADRQRFNMLRAAERQAQLVMRTFRPEYVGKGFQAFGAGLQQEMARQEQQLTPGGIAGWMRQFTGQATPDEIKFRKALADISDMLLRARSGAQINEQEYARLKGLLANIFDEPATFIPGMERFINEVGAQIDETLEVGSTPASKLLEQRRQRPTPPTTPTPVRPPGVGSNWIHFRLPNGKTGWEDPSKPLPPGAVRIP